MCVDLSFKSALEKYLDGIQELKNRELINYELILVDDIYEEIHKKDSEYATRLMQLECLNGLFYINKNNQFELYVKNNDFSNMFGTIVHEYIHMYDFYWLGLDKQTTDYRLLQEDYVFVFWSEFHATYLTYTKLLEIGREEINPEAAYRELIDKLQSYIYGKKRLDLHTTVDFMVRLYGEYIAIQKIYSWMPQYPPKFFLNKYFWDIYNYLYENRTFQETIIHLEELSVILHRLDKACS